MPLETTTAPVAGGGSSNDGSQANPIPPQGADGSQDATVTQVEGSEPQPSSQDGAGGRKASGFYKERERDRATIRELKNKISELESRIPVPSPSQPKPTVTNAKSQEFFENFLVDPNGAIQKLIDTTVIQTVGRERAESVRQEAEKLIVSTDAFKRDPDTFIANMKMITSDPEYEWLDAWAEKNPVAATKKALEIYSEKFGTRQPTAGAPKKGHLVSTATGSPSLTGGKSKESLIGELKQMQVELSEKPDTRKNPKFWEKYKAIKEQLMAA